MGVRALRKELADLDKEEIIHHVVEVYKRFPKAKAYFDFFVNPDEEQLLENFKARVLEGFYPQRGKRLKLYRSRRALNEFKKLATSPEAIASLEFYFVQVAVRKARETNIKSEAYYTRLEKAFRSVLDYLEQHALLQDFEADCVELIERCAPFPWNCHVHMETIYQNYNAAVSR